MNDLGPGALAPGLEPRAPLALRLTLEWPCLARAYRPLARGSDEVTVVLDVSVEGPADRMTGTVSTQVRSHCRDTDNCGESDAAHALVCAGPASAATGSVHALGEWTAIEVRTSSGVRADVLVRGLGAPAAHDGAIGPSPCPWYVWTNLHQLARLEGGRYGSPKLTWTLDPLPSADGVALAGGTTKAAHRVRGLEPARLSGAAPTSFRESDRPVRKRC